MRFMTRLASALAFGILTSQQAVGAPPGTILKTVPLPLPYASNTVQVGLVAQGSKLFVAHACQGVSCQASDPGSLSVLNNGRQVARFPLTYAPGGLAMFGKSLWTVDTGGRLHQVKATDGSEIISLDTGVAGPFWGLTADAQSLWVGRLEAGSQFTVQQLDPGLGTPVNPSVALGGAEPRLGLGWSAKTGFLTSTSAGIFYTSFLTGANGASIPAPQGVGGPLAPSGTTIWVPDGSATAVAIKGPPEIKDPCMCAEEAAKALFQANPTETNQLLYDSLLQAVAAIPQQAHFLSPPTTLVKDTTAQVRFFTGVGRLFPPPEVLRLQIRTAVADRCPGVAAEVPSVSATIKRIDTRIAVNPAGRS